MLRTIRVFRWFGVAFFALMGIVAFSEGGYFGGVILVLGALIIAPLGFVVDLRKNLELIKLFQS